MRGKANGKININDIVRITPAYAGKSTHGNDNIRVNGDHPRVCGEKPKPSSAPSLFVGSPPRMRGKEKSAHEPRRKHRITPAYAGKSTGSSTSSYGTEDHPRVCGEKLLPFAFHRILVGSPPRMRGKGKNTDRSERTAGITPAYAGKRLPLS